MEEADTLLLVSLKSLNVNMQSLDSFTAETFIRTLILCFEKIAV
jgi:hypothetical protein